MTLSRRQNTTSNARNVMYEIPRKPNSLAGDTTGKNLDAASGSTLAATATDASAQRRHGWGWGPGVAAGIIGGAIITGAILASRPRGYVVYEGYGQPVYGPGCYWASQPVYDRWGNVVGYSGQPVQICPGYRY